MRRIDIDQHLFETRTTWSDNIDPALRAEALGIVDDQRGWPWLAWRGRSLYPVELQHPGRPDEVGDNRLRMEGGEEAPGSYEDLLPAAYTDSAARVAALDDFGLDAAVLFPNFGLLLERVLSVDVAALCANLRAYNRWMSAATAGERQRLYGVAHLSLRDLDWALEELARLAGEGARLAMIAPAPVDGRPLSHPDLDAFWAKCCDTGISPVFHVGGFEGPLDPAWHQGDPEPGDRLLDSVFLWVAPGVAIANLILHGTLERFPELRIGVVELTAGWVPSFLLHIDGASDFYTARHGRPLKALPLRPSEYFRRQVRVASLPYERPAWLIEKVGDDLIMVGSDWPHAEGMGAPGADCERAVARLPEHSRSQALGGNAEWLLGLAG